MTDQDLKAKQNQLKKVREKISELGNEETALIRKVAQYKFNKNIRNKYFYAPDLEVWIKPIKLNGEKVICITFDTDKDVYKEIKDFHIEENYYWIYEFDNFQELDKETFKSNVEIIVKEAMKTILGG